MIERGIRHSPIVAPDSNPQSPGLNDLNHVIEPDLVVRRTSLYMEISRGAIRLMVKRRVTLVLVGEAH
jgi:hypothetical protein